MSTVLAVLAVLAFGGAFAVVWWTHPSKYGTRSYEVTVTGLMLLGITLAFAADRTA